VATVLLVCERRVWAAVRLSAYVYLAPAGGPSALAVPTVVFGADAHVAEAFAVGFLPPIIPSLGCGPFWTVLVWKVEPVFVLSMGFLRVPVSVFFVVVFSVLCSIIWSHELRRRVGVTAYYQSVLELSHSSASPLTSASGRFSFSKAK